MTAQGPAPAAARRPTLNQGAAADPGASSWVTASAGAGKTRVLTDRVLRLLLAGTPPGRILCLTFTKAAAAQMRERIVERLGAWAVMDDGSVAEELRALMVLKPSVVPPAGTLDAARRLLAAVLEVPGGLKIQTIHAFCQSLLGRFPLECGIASHFHVMDERTQAEHLHAARDDVLRLGRTDRSLETAIGEISSRVNESQFAELMAALSRDRPRLSRLLAGGLDAAIAKTRAGLGLAEGQTTRTILEAACAAGAFDEVGLRRAAAAMAKGGATDVKHGTIIADWLAQPADGRAQAFHSYTAAYFTAGGEGPIRHALIHADALALAPGAGEVLDTEAQRLDEVRERLLAAGVAEATGALLIFGDALLANYQQAKDRHALLDYDDLILRARDLLQRPGIAPWVLYKLDGGIDHILIDEAQDTSPEQWAVITAIADEFFAGEGAGTVRRTVFAVGDAKQSIYGFLRADPHAFRRQRDHFDHRVRDVGGDWRPLELNESFRSTKPVLAAVDAIFKDPPANDGLLIAEAQVRHFSSRAGQAGAVEVWPIVEPEPPVPASAWDLPTDQQWSSSSSAKLAERIATTVAEWIGTEALASRSRTVAPGDVLILVQRRGVFVEEVIRALKARNVPVAGTDRMVISEQLPVMDLMALGHFVLLPEDDLNLAVVLKGPFIGLDEDGLFTLAHGRTESLWATLGKRAADGGVFAAARLTLSQLLARADFVPPHTFFAEFLAAGGRRQILARLGTEANDPIDEFLARTLEFERTHPPSLQGFLAWIKAGRADVKRDLELGRDEVRVMTVHGAKGLEAPIVILADTRFVPTKEEELLWDDDGALMVWRQVKDKLDERSKRLRQAALKRRDEEYRRLLYVALTRAEDRLVVCGWKTGKPLDDDCWYNLIARGLEALGNAEALADGSRRWTEAQAEGVPPDRAETAEASSGVPSPPPPEWLGQTAAPEEPDPPRPLAPSRPEGEEPSVFSPLAESGRALRRGILIHRMLQVLAEIPSAAREPAARRFLAAQGTEFAAPDRNEMMETTLGVLGAPEFAGLFGPHSRAEVSIAGTVGDVVIVGQIDRLVNSDHEVLIVDFKTHRPAPADEAGVAPVYLRQMAAYRGALRAVYPGKTVRCALLWTDGPRLMPLSEAALDAAAP